MPTGELPPIDGQKKRFQTGDIGFIREGQLYICGRLKDLIIVRGRHLFPQDIERYARSLPALASLKALDCAVAVSAEPTVESINLVVEIRKNDLPLEGLMRELAGELTRQFGVTMTVIAALPRTIPKTTSGKFRRQLLFRHVAQTE